MAFCLDVLNVSVDDFEELRNLEDQVCDEAFGESFESAEVESITVSDNGDNSKGRIV